MKKKYNDIKRVFNIWVCMNMDENTMAYMHLTQDNLLGEYMWKGRLDLLNIVMIGISNGIPERNKDYELHRLLGTLFSSGLSSPEKLKIIETEYDIPIDDQIRKDVDEMCNLGQGIFEKGEARGEARGEIRGEIRGEAKFILRMHKKGYTIEQIADVSEKSLEEIRAILENKESVFL